MTSDKPKKFTNRRYLDAIDRGVVLFDGAMGTNLDRQHLTVEDFGGERTAGCNDYLVITKPSAIEKVHRSFLEAGSDVIETDSFRSNRLTLAEFGLGDRVLEINRAAASLARRVADEFSTPEKPRFVAGSMGPSGKLISTEDLEMSNISFEELADVFREQAVGLIEGGADLLLIETSQDILEVKAVIQGIKAAFEETGEILPIQAQVTLDTTGRMLLGTDIAATRAILEEMGIDVIGLNCSTGPDYMREPIRFLTENSRLPVSCIPNAGLPLNVDGEAVYPMEPQPFADLMLEFVNDYGVRVVGGVLRHPGRSHRAAQCWAGSRSCQTARAARGADAGLTGAGRNDAPGARTLPDWRKAQHPGLSQVQTADHDRRLRRHCGDGPRPGG